MRRLMPIVLYLMLAVTISAQVDGNALECASYKRIISKFGDLPFRTYEEDSVLVAVSVANYLKYLDSVLGGECSGRRTRMTLDELLMTARGHDSGVVRRGYHHISSETHPIHGLLEPFVLEPGWYRYVTTNVHHYRTSGKASIGEEFRPEGCTDLWLENFDDQGRFTVKKRCKVYLQIYNDDRVPWSLTISLEE